MRIDFRELSLRCFCPRNFLQLNHSIQDRISLVRRAFGARRKTLRNAWAGLAADPASLERAAGAAGIALDARGETLEVEAFARMASALEGLTVQG